MQVLFLCSCLLLITEINPYSYFKFKSSITIVYTTTYVCIYVCTDLGMHWLLIPMPWPHPINFCCYEIHNIINLLVFNFLIFTCRLLVLWWSCWNIHKIQEECRLQKQPEIWQNWILSQILCTWKVIQMAGVSIIVIQNGFPSWVCCIIRTCMHTGKYRSLWTNIFLVVKVPSHSKAHELDKFYLFVLYICDLHNLRELSKLKNANFYEQ